LLKKNNSIKEIRKSAEFSKPEDNKIEGGEVDEEQEEEEEELKEDDMFVASKTVEDEVADIS
jgi:hypothetical protein